MIHGDCEESSPFFLKNGHYIIFDPFVFFCAKLSLHYHKFIKNNMSFSICYLGTVLFYFNPQRSLIKYQSDRRHGRIFS